MTDKKQIDKFREAAKELECNESEVFFDKALRRIVNIPKSDKAYRSDEQAEED